MSDRKIGCCECNSGIYEESIEPYEFVKDASLRDAVILRCPECGDELLPPETLKRIDEAMNETLKEIIGLPNSVHPVIEKALKEIVVGPFPDFHSAAIHVMEAIAEAGFVIVKKP